MLRRAGQLSSGAVLAAAGAALAFALAAARVDVSAADNTGVISGVVTSEGTRGRRLGDCRDGRPADEVPQDRGDRRAGRFLLPELPRANFGSGSVATASSTRSR